MKTYKQFTEETVVGSGHVAGIVPGESPPVPKVVQKKITKQKSPNLLTRLKPNM